MNLGRHGRFDASDNNVEPRTVGPAVICSVLLHLASVAACASPGGAVAPAQRRRARRVPPPPCDPPRRL